MNKLGTIKVICAGLTLDLPYFSESEFDDIVTKTKAYQGFRNNDAFVPYHALIAIMRIQEQVATSSNFEGMTKQ